MLSKKSKKYLSASKWFTIIAALECTANQNAEISETDRKTAEWGRKDVKDEAVMKEEMLILEQHVRYPRVTCDLLIPLAHS